MVDTCGICFGKVRAGCKKVAPCGFANACFHVNCLKKMQHNEEFTAWKTKRLPIHRCPHCNVVVRRENNDEERISIIQNLVEDEFRFEKSLDYCRKHLVYQVFERGSILMGDREAMIVKSLVGGILDTIHKYGFPDIGVTVRRNQDSSRQHRVSQARRVHL